MRLKKSGIVTKLIILALAAYALIALVQMKSRVEDAEAERDALRAEAQALAVTNASLNYEISHAKDKETVEKVAREKLGLVLPGEIVFYDISD